jgi:hypothetical protein
MRAVWNPGAGPDVARQQVPPRPAVVDASGRVRCIPGCTWMPSEGPCRGEPGGAGGEPDGRSISIRTFCWD